MERVCLCPFCIERRGKEDIKGHLYVNRDKNVYFCFACKASGRAEELEKVKLTVKTFARSNSPVYHSAPGVPVWELGGLTRQYAFTYLAKRGVVGKDVYYYQVRMTPEDNILWFPVYGVPGGHPLWYQGKIIGGTYRMPKGCMYCKHTLFRTYGVPILQYKPEVTVLTEGIFDAIKVGRIIPALCGFGKNVTKARLEVLPYVTQAVIVMLDRDAHREAVDVVVNIRKWLDVPAVTADTSTLNGDPADTPKETLEMIINKALEVLHGRGNQENSTA